MKLVDTNILMEKPSILEDPDIIISIKVLKELDGLKRHQNPEVAEKARRAAIYISRQLGELKFDLNEDNIPTDDMLLKIAEQNQYSIITNDVYLKIRAAAQGIETFSYSEKDGYTGVRYLAATEEELIAQIIQGEDNQLVSEMRENEYLIVETEQPQYFKKKNGRLIPVRYQNIKNQYVGTLKPRNPEQVCLFDALNERNNTILYAGGSFGRGKSFLLNNYALSELETGEIRKIVYIPNNALVDNTLDIGALPGGVLDKVVGQIGPLIDLIGIDRVQQMIREETLEIVPMAYARGRSFLNTIIIVNEAQNLTADHMKLLIGRVGDGSRIFFDGSLKQIDNQLFKNKNGIQLLLKLSNSEIYSKIFSTVKLIKTERSFTASAADYLEELE